jgi:TupA-like ATPgrasp
MARGRVRDHFGVARLIAQIIPDRLFLALRYRITFGRWPNLDNPTSYNEQILHLIVSRREATLRSRVADKLAMRPFVIDIVGPGYLAHIHQQATSFAGLDWARLPDQFVLKTNHGSGQVFLVMDKAAVDKQRLQRLCDGWLKADFSRHAREYVYRGIPAQVFAEELLVADSGLQPTDVKAHVFFGKVRFYRINENALDNEYNEVYYNVKWEQLPFDHPWYLKNRNRRSRSLRDWPRPKLLDRMTEIAEKLGSRFSFIRVDFCDLGNRFVITELTSFPASGNDRVHPDHFEHMLGWLFWPPGHLTDEQAAEIQKYFP